MRQYRDADGRVRMEPSVSNSEPAKSIIIYDPVAGVNYHLDPARKTATKTVTMPASGSSVNGGGREPRGPSRQTASGANSSNAALQQAIQVLGEFETDILAARNEARNNGGNVTVEDLGTLTVNGVPARGTRVTTLVPVGAIGNDKEFRSVTERWFSPDLNLLIKSVSTDPRFGATTYELTDISRQPPDPSLFQAPAEYSVISSAPRQPAAKVIEEIEVRGAKRISPDALKAIVHSKPGDVYSEEGLRNDFTALWNTGRFSDVQVKTETGAHGGVVIRFIVTERP
jgi:hypothetical protein